MGQVGVIQSVWDKGYRKDIDFTNGEQEVFMGILILIVLVIVWFFWNIIDSWHDPIIGPRLSKKEKRRQKHARAIRRMNKKLNQKAIKDRKKQEV